jgi:hypothetical protein
MFDPVIISDVFSPSDLSELRMHIDKASYPSNYDFVFQRSTKSFPELEDHFSKILEPMAKELFKDDTLKTSYSLYSKYQSKNSKLSQHKDDNACTYTIDLCLSAKTPWGIFVEGNEYILHENQALAFMGEDQEHWRGPFPDPKTNCVEMVFFHFVPEDHWFFTKGRDYIHQIRGQKGFIKYQ